jgi:hypothetical protein
MGLVGNRIHRREAGCHRRSPVDDRVVENTDDIRCSDTLPIRRRHNSRHDVRIVENDISYEYNDKVGFTSHLRLQIIQIVFLWSMDSLCLYAPICSQFTSFTLTSVPSSRRTMIRSQQGLADYDEPRHSMPFNSRNEGSKRIPVRKLFAASEHAIQLKKRGVEIRSCKKDVCHVTACHLAQERGLEMRVDDVASNFCQVI